MEYERKIIEVGNSLGLILPADLCKYLDLEKDSQIIISDDTGKYGRFISIWNKKQPKLPDGMKEFEEWKNKQEE